MQIRKCTIDHSNQRHTNTEEDRIGHHGKNSLCKLSFCRRKENHILTQNRKDKSYKELQRPTRQHKFRIEQEACLQYHPATPNDLCSPLAVFQRGGINAGSSMCDQQKYKTYRRSDHTQLILLSLVLIIPKGIGDLVVLASRNGNAYVVVKQNVCA